MPACALIIRGITGICNESRWQMLSHVNTSAQSMRTDSWKCHRRCTNVSCSARIYCSEAQMMCRWLLQKFHQPDRAMLTAAPLPASTIILLNNAEPSLLLLAHSVILSAQAAATASRSWRCHQHANSRGVGLLAANSIKTVRIGHPTAGDSFIIRGLRSLGDQN